MPSRSKTWLFILIVVLVFPKSPAQADDGNRLAYLDEFMDPYYVGLHTAKLATPQWEGDPGVDMVIILSIDDMYDPEKYESYLRPILDRLKKIDGRAPVSIMACNTPTDHPQHQSWLEEGLSIETHTVDHPCPLMDQGDFASARRNFEDVIDLMFSIPNNRPTTFRMPCFDSQNNQTPRFFAELFNRVTTNRNFLALDSSISNVTTSRDPSLPSELVRDADGGERFRKYLTKYGSRYVNSVEDYPYPYVVGGLCWELPSPVPDDWSGQNLNGSNSPTTIADWKAAFRVAVLKQGTIAFTFHPYNWIHNDLIVGLVDHVVEEYGPRVRFLTFAEVEQRLNANLLAGHPLRASNGEGNGVKLIDLDNDGYMDVVIANEKERRTRIWSPEESRWIESGFPLPLVEVDDDGTRVETGVRFGILQSSGQASFVIRNATRRGVWHYQGENWVRASEDLPVDTALAGRDRGVRLRDLDRDGICELIVGNEDQRGVFAWQEGAKTWKRLPFELPAETQIVTSQGKDAGLRFVDFDEDGHDDVLFSNATRYSAHLFSDLKRGWARTAVARARNDTEEAEPEIPMFVRADGSNNGAWIKDRHVWAANEDTGNIPARVSFTDLLKSTDALARSPEESLRSIIVRPGFRVELMAAEPMVMDPINLEWGPDGKLWVVEMADYPMGLDDRGKPGGRIRTLEDRDGDGRYDHSTLFLDGLSFPNSVLPWGNGVLITAAPELIYAEDRDGDGVADHREVLFHGFRLWNQQHLVNGLRWGLDNWVYLANGDSGGTVVSVKTGQRVELGQRDLRVRPDEGLIELQAGQSQFGRERDDWGNWFSCNNPNPGWHYALLDHYTRRNPYSAPPDARVYFGTDRRVYPISRLINHCFIPQALQDDGSGTFTSCCGLCVYRDDLFDEHFWGNVFTSEPVHNVIHRRVLRPKGVTFEARRATGEERAEFLASSDPWFRPTTLRAGPDGALWVADMYRFVLEHPEWIDDELEKQLFLREGHDRGRLYRIVPIDREPRRVPRLDGLSTESLVAELDSPSGWQRDTVHRMLVRRADPAALAPLRTLLRTKHESMARARLHALCILDGLKALTPELVVHALHDGHPGVRRHAVRLSESMLESSPAVAEAVLRLLDDPDLPIQIQLSYSLGEWNDSRAGEALGKLALRHHGDPLIRAAVRSSSVPQIATLLRIVKGNSGVLMDLLPTAIATGKDNPDGLLQVLRILSSPSGGSEGSFTEQQYHVLGHFLDTLSRQNSSLGRLHGEARGEVKVRIEALEAVFSSARRVALDSTESIALRAKAARLLGRGIQNEPEDLTIVAGFLNPKTPVDLQVSIVGSLNHVADQRIPKLLLENWTAHTPQVREAALDALLSRESWSRALFKEMESRPSLSNALDVNRRSLFLGQLPEGDRERAEKLFGGGVKKDRREVLEKYAGVLETEGEASRGKLAFEAQCSKCHRYRDVGQSVGPDLATLTSKTPQSLLTAILDPNSAVEDKYVQYLAVTVDGRTLTGLIANETGNSLTLRGAEAREEVVLRKDLVSLTSSGLSQMPEGLEKDLEVQALADLIAYLMAE